MRKPHKYHSETWQEDFLYFIGWPGRDFEAYLKTVYGKLAQTKDADGMTIELPDGTICLWTRIRSGKYFYEVLAHEAVHAATFCLASKGVEPSYANDEPLAYLVSEIFRKGLENVK